jgi:hypothetical protein
MPLADSRTKATRGRTCQWREAVLGGRAGPRPPRGGLCWPVGALPRWLPFPVKQVLKQASTCLRTADLGLQGDAALQINPCGLARCQPRAPIAFRRFGLRRDGHPCTAPFWGQLGLVVSTVALCGAKPNSLTPLGPVVLPLLKITMCSAPRLLLYAMKSCARPSACAARP